jgi:SAM-dependent methyltransferase
MFAAFWNALDYPLRQRFRWRRRGLQFKNEAKDRLFARLPDEARALAQATAGRLLETYHLHALFFHSRADNYRENLFYLELLESALQRARATLPLVVKAADIGVSQWFYVQALFALLQWWQPVDSEALPEEGREVTLSGFEADAYRVYVDLYSRYDYAQAHLRGLEQAHFVPRRFEPQPGAFQLITLLFPFVFLRDHLKWGLPRPLFAPEALLAEAWASLAPGGLLVIVNQGEAEHAAQRDLLQRAGMPVVAAFCHESLLYRYDLLRYVLVARR